MHKQIQLTENLSGVYSQYGGSRFARSNHMLEDGFYKSTCYSNHRGGDQSTVP